MNVKQIEKVGIEAVRKLRENKLKNGFPFMINTNGLPVGHCYLEYSDGLIKMVTLCRKIYDFKVVKELTIKEANALRKRYKLVEIKV